MSIALVSTVNKLTFHQRLLYEMVHSNMLLACDKQKRLAWMKACQLRFSLSLAKRLLRVSLGKLMNQHSCRSRFRTDSDKVIALSVPSHTCNLFLCHNGTNRTHNLGKSAKRRFFLLRQGHPLDYLFRLGVGNVATIDCRGQ